MPFNTTIEDVLNAGVRVDFTNDDARIADMEAADQRFLQPVLGDLLAVLLSSTDAKYNDVKKLCKRAEAFLAYWLDLPSIQTRITDKSVSTNDSGNSNAAHRWEFNELREMLGDKGCWNLETLLQYLYQNAATIGWVEPDDYKSIFRTAKDFNSIYTLFQPYRTFNAMGGIIKNVEEKYIMTAIGEDFFLYLRDYTGDDAATKKAIKMLKQAVAYLSIYKATKALRVKFRSEGFTVLLNSNNDMPNQGDANAPDKQVSAMGEDAERDGGDYLEKLTAFLDKNASENVFPLYFGSEFYTAPPQPDEAPPDPNENRAVYGL